MVVCRFHWSWSCTVWVTLGLIYNRIMVKSIFPLPLIFQDTITIALWMMSNSTRVSDHNLSNHSNLFLPRRYDQFRSFLSLLKLHYEFIWFSCRVDPLILKSCSVIYCHLDTNSYFHIILMSFTEYLRPILTFESQDLIKIKFEAS